MEDMTYDALMPAPMVRNAWADPGEPGWVWDAGQTPGNSRGCGTGGHRASPPPRHSRRWKPRWALVLAVFGLVVAALAVGSGGWLVIQDLSAHDDWLDGLGVVIGAVLSGAGLLLAVPFALFTWLGGRALLITGYVILACLVLLALPLGL